MKFKLNSSPHLKMHEITKKLFNRKFLSDIQFSVGGKIIYAHSLELMKRSVVFEEQLEETLGDRKLIPITDCSYDSFYEFVRFIYTDECNITDGNGIELLKLANKYQVIMLESHIINLLDSVDWGLKLFEHCVIEKYDIARNNIDYLFVRNFVNRISNPKFSSIHPDAISKALEFDGVEKGLTEKQIFIALAGWIENYCKNHKISLSEGRQQFDALVRKVRFPTMTIDEIRECVKQYPELLNQSDLNSIAGQKAFGDDSVNNCWVSKRRSDYQDKLAWNILNRDESFETTFTVSKQLILHGIWIGVEKSRKDIEIDILAKDIKTNEIEKIAFTQSSPAHWGRMLINLGDSLSLEPNFEYTIAAKYLEVTNENIEVSCRDKKVDLMYNDPENSIKIIKASENMIEMCFKALPE